MWMRGGTSKGGFFLASDLPADTAARDAFLLRAMGSPDTLQIDGMGGADPLTSKVALVSRSVREGADVDYLFLQVFVDQAIVTDSQNCGNMLAGVGPFAIERGLVPATGDETRVAIYMMNTGQIAVATCSTPGGSPTYEGEARIEAIRLRAGPLMNLGGVAEKSVPKMMLVAPPRHGGTIAVRSLIPHRAHATIGVLGAVSVATACLVPGSPAAEVARVPAGSRKTLSVEHPTGEMSCVLELDGAGTVTSAALLRTARKLMDGEIFA